MNKFLFLLLLALAALVALPACSAVPFVAQNEPTETATRRIRPTFTPKPRPTETEEIIPTEEPTEEPEATDEPAPTEEPPTAAPKPVTKAPKPPSQPKATQPPEPTAVPKPAFAVNVTSQYLCEQEGIYEVAFNLKQGKGFPEGIAFAAFDGAGNLLRDGAEKEMVSVTYPASQSTGSNCRLSGSFDTPNVDNGKLDVADAARRGVSPIIIRFVKSPTDMTPISPDIPVNFGKGGRYWVFAQMK